MATTERTIAGHGTRARYQDPHLCRCTECTKANTLYQRSYRQRRTPTLRSTHAGIVVEQPPLW